MILVIWVSDDDEESIDTASKRIKLEEDEIEGEYASVIIVILTTSEAVWFIISVDFVCMYESQSGTEKIAQC